MKQVYEAIRKSVEENQENMLSLWEKLVNIDSGSENIAGVEAVCSLLKQEMEAIGMETKVIPSGGAGSVLVGEWSKNGTKRPLLFIGHMDTVFKDGAAKERPFTIDEKGFAHGPGVLDMKAGLVIALFAIKALRDVGYTDRPIKCIFAGDEENLHIFSNTKEIFISELGNAEAAFNFETGYMDDGLVVGRRGCGSIDVIVHGVSAHSGNAPEKGRSAIVEMAHKIIDIESNNDLEREKLINCGIVNGGIGPNTVPGEAKVSITIRFPSLAIKNEILADIQCAVEQVHIEGTRCEMQIRSMMESMETTKEVMSLFRHVEKVAEECGYGKVHPFSVGGMSDSSITVSQGIPTVCAMGVKGEANHTANEYAVVSSLFERAVLAACAACAL